MATTVARLQAILDADTRAFDRKMKDSQTKTEKFGHVAKAALIGGVAAGVTAVGVAAKIGWDEYNQGAQVAAQTNAAIKSTGGIAGVTAKHVRELGDSMLRVTGIDDEATKAAENQLLTFTKIGAKGGIFDLTTLQVANLATRLNNGAIPSMEKMSSTAIMVGKALNNPTKGLTRLQRVGVEFTDQETKKIQKLQETGKTMEAQQVILSVLQEQYGGSAAAAGNTFAGSITKLHERLNNFLGDLVEKAIPYVQDFIKWIGPYAQDALDKTQEVVAHIRRAFTRFNEILDEHRDTVNKVTKVLGILATAVTFLWKWEIKLYLKLVDIWLKILSVTLTVTDKIIAAFGKVIDWIGRTIDWFEKLWDKTKGPIGQIGDFISDKLVGPFKSAVGWVEKLIGFVKDLVGWIGKIDFPDIPSWVPVIGGNGDGIISAGFGGAGAPQRAISSTLWDDIGIGQSMGLGISSGYRPGARTSSGNPSLHGVFPSKAVDMAGSAASMQRYFALEVARAGATGLREIIHSPYWWHPGVGVSRITDPEVMAGHYSHVHVGSYDRGGYLRPGWNLAYNGLGRPEPVGAGPTYNFNGAILDGDKLYRMVRDLEQNHRRRGGS